MGDGEVCGTAVEYSSTTTIHVDLIKGWQLEWPRLENERIIMAIGSARPLEDATRIAYKELILCAGGPDGTYHLAKTFTSAQVLVFEQKPGEGKQRALQRCFEQSHGVVIFLTDADCLLEDRVFERTLYPLVVEGKDAATGTWRPSNPSR